jgi:co-chaperonin GroES (HSP10)
MRHALNFHIVIEPIKRKKHTVAGGLELGEKFDKELRYLTGKVISIGSRVVKEMENEPVTIEPGDIIYYDQHAGHEIRWTDDLPLKVLKLGDLVAIDKDE